ncbi:hypothetical protein ABZ609_26130, partial [Streptomyces rubiginosohelvolus]
MTAVLKAGLVGLGSMGRHHARVLASLEGVELVGVVDPMGDKNGWAQGALVLVLVFDLAGSASRGVLTGGALVGA